MCRKAPDSMVRGFGEGVKPRRRAGPARVTVLLGFLDSRPKRRIWEGCAFRGQRRTHPADETRIGSSAGQEVRACRGQTQDAVGAAAHHIRIHLVLTIVLPPADGAELEDSRSSQRPAATA